MQKKKKRVFLIQVAFWLVFSLSILAMHFTDRFYGQQSYRTILCINGVLFWLSLLLFLIISIFINLSRRKDKVFRRWNKGKRQLGLINFFQNKPAKIMDIVFIISLLIFIVLYASGTRDGFKVFLIFAVLIFSFGMHCILNGINYVYLNHNGKEGDKHE